MFIFTCEDLDVIISDSFILPGRIPHDEIDHHILRVTVSGIVAVIVESRATPIPDEVTKTKYVGELILQNRFHHASGKMNSEFYIETIASEWCRMFDSVVKIMGEKHEQA